jgi:hypothetical protein
MLQFNKIRYTEIINSSKNMTYKQIVSKKDKIQASTFFSFRNRRTYSKYGHCNDDFAHWNSDDIRKSLRRKYRSKVFIFKQRVAVL